MTTTKPILQLSFVNAATRALRKDVKDIAGDDQKTTERNIDRSTKNVVKYFSRLKVDTKTQSITGASQETIEQAEKWADRVARPFELGLKSGAQVAFVWDWAFSVLVGRGVKADESPVSLRGLSTANKAHNWTALRQEGLLGMLTRLPAAAVGNLVGRCYSDAAKAKNAKDTIKNATIGFNTVLRAATLTSSAAAIMMTGVLVGTGVSALVSLVALPKLILTKTDKGASQAAAEGAPANKATKQAKAEKAVPKTALKAAEKAAPTAAADNAFPASDISPADLKTLSKRYAAAAEALAALQPKATTPTDKMAAGLEKKVDAAATEVKKLRSAEAGKIDYTALSEAIGKLGDARKAFDTHQAGVKNAQTTRAKLVANLETAQKKFDAANAQETTQPEALKPLLEALQNARGAVASHNKQYGTPSAPAPASKAALKKATKEVEGFQEIARVLSTTAASLKLQGKKEAPEIVQMRENYATIKGQWASLHQSNVVASAQLPSDTKLTEIMTRTAGEASNHLGDGFGNAEKLMAMASKHAASHEVLKSLRGELAEAQANTRKLTEATVGLPDDALEAADAGVVASRQNEQRIQKAIDMTLEDVSPEVELYKSVGKAFIGAQNAIATHAGHAQLLYGEQTPDGAKLQDSYITLGGQIVDYQELDKKRR